MGGVRLPRGRDARNRVNICQLVNIGSYANALTCRDAGLPKEVGGGVGSGFMTRTDSGLTATTEERRRFRLLIRLARVGPVGQPPRSLIRAGGSIERAAFTEDLQRLVERGIIEPCGSTDRFRLTQRAADSMAILFPDVTPAEPETPDEPVLNPPTEFVWQPRDPERVDVDPSPQPPGDYFWTSPEPAPELVSTPEDFWAGSIGEATPAPAGFWS